MTAELKEANKQLEIAKAKLASSQIDGLFQNAVEVDGVRIVTVYLNGTTPDTLRSMMDKLRDKEPNAVGALIGHRWQQDHPGCRRWQKRPGPRSEGWCPG